MDFLKKLLWKLLFPRSWLLSYCQIYCPLQGYTNERLHIFSKDVVLFFDRMFLCACAWVPLLDAWLSAMKVIFLWLSPGHMRAHISKWICPITTLLDHQTSSKENFSLSCEDLWILGFMNIRISLNFNFRDLYSPHPQIEATPQTGRTSCVNFSNVIHYPLPKNPPDPPHPRHPV